jgi:hypothetical protein
MRKLLPVMFAAATVMAVVSTAHAQYTAIAGQLQVQRTQSAEILRVHASVSLVVEQALAQPTLPDFVPSLFRRG